MCPISGSSAAPGCAPGCCPLPAQGAFCCVPCAALLCGPGVSTTNSCPPACGCVDPCCPVACGPDCCAPVCCQPAACATPPCAGLLCVPVIPCCIPASC